MVVQVLPERLEPGVVTEAARAEAGRLPISADARIRMGFEVGPQPILLWGASTAAADLAAVRVEDVDPPTAEVVRVVALARLAGSGPEVAEVTGGAVDRVFAGAGRRAGSIEERSPGGPVAGPKLVERAGIEGVITNREDGPRDGADELRGCLIVSVGARGNRAGADEHRVARAIARRRAAGRWAARAIGMKRVDIAAVARSRGPLDRALDARPVAPLVEAADQLESSARRDHRRDALRPAGRVTRQAGLFSRPPETGVDRVARLVDLLIAQRRIECVPLVGPARATRPALDRRQDEEGVHRICLRPALDHVAAIGCGSPDEDHEPAPDPQVRRIIRVVVADVLERRGDGRGVGVGDLLDLVVYGPGKAGSSGGCEKLAHPPVGPGAGTPPRRDPGTDAAIAHRLDLAGQQLRVARVVGACARMEVRPGPAARLPPGLWIPAVVERGPERQLCVAAPGGRYPRPDPWADRRP